MDSGWNNKNTLDFGFDENGNHIIFNMDGEIVDEASLKDSPLCGLMFHYFKQLHPTKELYEQRMREVGEYLRKLDGEKIVNVLSENMRNFIQNANIK